MEIIGLLQAKDALSFVSSSFVSASPFFSSLFSCSSYFSSFSGRSKSSPPAWSKSLCGLLTRAGGAINKKTISKRASFTKFINEIVKYY